MNESAQVQQLKQDIEKIGFRNRQLEQMIQAKDLKIEGLRKKLLKMKMGEQLIGIGGAK